MHNLDYIANIHLQFIGKIIKDIKLRTNRILLGQLGREVGKELGHNVNALQKEENVHVGRLCEVLERIFSHGLKKRNSQSALWSFLTEFKVYAGPEATEEQIDPNYPTEGFLTSFAKRVAGLGTEKTPKKGLWNPLLGQKFEDNKSEKGLQ